MTAANFGPNFLGPSYQSLATSQSPVTKNKYILLGLTDSVNSIFALTEPVRTKFSKTLDFMPLIVYDDAKARVRRP